MRQRHNQGFGLIETILLLVVGGLLIAGVFSFYRFVSVNFQAHKASQHAIDLTDSVMRAWASAPSFVGISNSQVVSEGLLPPGIEVHGRSSDPKFTTAFGGGLVVDPKTLDGQAGRGLTLTFTDVPKKMCGQFVSNAAGYGYRSITINSQDVLDAYGTLREHVAASECAARPESTVVFTVDRDFVGGAHTPGGMPTPGTPAPSTACVLPSPSTQTQTEACPAGYVGTVGWTRTANCPHPIGQAQWGPWTETRSCAPACRRAVHSPQRRTSTPCPAGQLGAITEQRVSECPSASGLPVWSGWAVVSNTCAPLCMAPADELDMSTPCPAGQSGLIVHRRTASCPERTGEWHWNEWEEMSNTCH